MRTVRRSHDAARSRRDPPAQRRSSDAGPRVPLGHARGREGTTDGTTWQCGQAVVPGGAGGKTVAFEIVQGGQACICSSVAERRPPYEVTNAPTTAAASASATFAGYSGSRSSQTGIHDPY